MIIESLFNIIFKFLNFVIDLLPTIPGGNIVSSLDSVLNLVFSNLNFLEIFVRPTTIKVLIPLLIPVLFFEETYNTIMWVLRKLPFLNIK